MSLADLRVFRATAAFPCRAGVSTRSPVAGAPAVPQSGAALMNIWLYSAVAGPFAGPHNRIESDRILVRLILALSMTVCE